MRILFLGSGFLGNAILEGLLDLQAQGRVDIVGVFPWSKTRKGKTLKDDGEVQLVKTSRQHKLKIIQCPGANHFEFNQYLQTLKPDIVLVGCWGEILKPHLVQRTDLKLINCHPSKLPAHRGANPYVSTIVMGETESGVTFHWMGIGIDDGPIVLQEPVPISPDDTGGTLREKCCEAAKKIIPMLVDAVSSSTIEDYPSQDESAKSYYPQITLGDGILPWEQPPTILLNRLRGLKPWLSCYSMLQGQLLYIFHELTLESREQFAANHPSLNILSGQVPEQIPAGTIVAKDGSVLWIQSSESELLYRTDDYQFYLGWGFVPKWLSRMLSKNMVHIGHRFLQAFVQGVVTQSQQTNPEAPNET